MVKVALATLKRNYRISQRAYPWSFLVNRILIGIYTVLTSYFIYHYLFSQKVSEEYHAYSGGLDYLSFVVLGASLYSLGVSIWMNVGRTLMIELREGTLEVLFLSPGSRIGYFLGSLWELLARALLGFMTILLLGMLLGIKIGVINFGGIIFIMALAVSSFFAMGIALAGLMLLTRDTYITQNTVAVVLNFLCGISFPIQYLPFPLNVMAHLFPLTSAIELFRKVLILGQSITLYSHLILELSALTVIYLLLGFWWLAKAEHKILENSFS